MSVKTIDNIIYYLLLLYALASSLSIAASNVAISLAILFTIIRRIKGPISFRADQRLVQAIFFFWVTILISALATHDQGIAINKLWAYISRALPLFLAVCFIDSRKRIFDVLIVMTISITISDFYAVWQGFHGIRAGAFANYMVLSGCLLQLIPVLFVLAMESVDLSRNSRIYFGIIGIFSVIALIFTLTRGAWLAVLVAIVIYGVLSLRSRPKMALILCLLLVVSAGSIYNFPTLQHRAKSIVDISISGKNTGRLLVWQGAWRMFVDHPIVGVGPGNFENVYHSSYMSPKAKEHLGHAHNSFLQILAENGIVGFGGFIVMFGYILVYLYKRGIGRKNPLALAVFLATIAFLIQGLTEFNFGDSTVIRMYWFLLGLAAIDFKEGTGRLQNLA